LPPLVKISLRPQFFAAVVSSFFKVKIMLGGEGKFSIERLRAKTTKCPFYRFISR
jgi:hypothetical protein